jgi:predicted nucleotidyltransferase component of viral defense system
MGRKEMNIGKYVSEVKKNMNLAAADDVIEKDLLLTFLLAEFQKQDGVFNELIFKGGTLLSRNYLKYHRFSEDLDFVHKDSNLIRELTRSARERKIKQFIDIFVLRLKEVADSLELEFSTDRSNQKYCYILSGRTVYTFKLYYSEERYIKVEINFIEKTMNKPVELSVKAITDFFDSKELMFVLGLKIDNFKVLSYPLEEIILEKYRAILTRKKLQERDLFDLFLIKNSLKVNMSNIVEKIKASSLIRKDLNSLIQEKLKLLEQGIFFRSEERIEELAICDYDKNKFEEFKKNIEPILIEICRSLIGKNGELSKN